MNDPIERQAAKEAYCKKFCHPGVLCPDSGFCREVDEAFDPVPSAQPEPLVKESRTLVKDLVKDTISRQAAIDLAKDLIIPGADYLQHNQAIMNYEAELVRLPSAQPESEERKAEYAQNVPIEDLISRKAAIDALAELEAHYEVEDGHDHLLRMAKISICALPSAQPAPCEFCKHNNIADDKACLMCSAERRTDEGD